MIQPILTASFSSLALSRTLNAHRAEAAAHRAQEGIGELEENGFGAAFSVDPATRSKVDPVGHTATEESESVAGEFVRESVDRDAGKPRSASGDVLDLSASSATQPKGQATAEAGGTAAAASSTTAAQSFSSQSSSSQPITGASTPAQAYQAQSIQTVASSDTPKVAGKADGATKEADDSESAEAAETNKASKLASGGQELTKEEQAQVDELRARDLEVRTHEAAHIAAAGPYAQGGASYTYQTGPDGKRYAIGGEVSIDASPISGDPQATIAKMQQVRNAALAPLSPSSQDQKVAAAASQAEAKARMELQQQRQEEMQQNSDENANAVNGQSGQAESENAKVATGAKENSENATVRTGSNNENGFGNAGVNAAVNTLPALSGKTEGTSGINLLAARENVETITPTAEDFRNSIHALSARITGSIPTADLGKSVADGGQTALQRKDNTAAVYLANSRLASNAQAVVASAVQSTARSAFYA